MNHRNPLSVGILSLLSFGLYFLVWLKQTRDEMVSKGAAIPSYWLILLPALLFMAAVITQIVTFAVSGGDTLLQANGPVLGAVGAYSRYSTQALVYGGVLLITVGSYWFYAYCRGVALVTNNDLPFNMAYGSLIGFGFMGLLFAWQGLVQNSFNQIAKEDQLKLPS